MDPLSATITIPSLPRCEVRQVYVVIEVAVKTYATKDSKLKPGVAAPLRNGHPPPVPIESFNRSADADLHPLQRRSPRTAQAGDHILGTFRVIDGNHYLPERKPNGEQQ